MNNDDKEFQESISATKEFLGALQELTEKSNRAKALRKAAEESAEELRAYYEALKKQGFTSDQAYGILVEIIRLNNRMKR